MRRYRAFLSYSHKDQAWGKWLHGALEHYRVPRRLGVDLRHLRPVFRDDEETPSAPNLSEVIQQALESSDTLVVICSPNAARSQWVDKEIRDFKRLGKAESIYPVIIDGTPHGETDDCFPPALKYDVDEEGRLTEVRTEPLAVDVRTHGRRDTLLKLVAGVLAVDYDDLKRRDRARAFTRYAAILTLGFAVLSLYALTLLMQTRAVSRQLSLVLAAIARSQGDAVDTDTLEDSGSYERALRFSVLASQTGLLVVPAPEAEAQLIRAAHRSRAVTSLVGHTDFVHLAFFSPSGEKLLTTSTDDTIRVWDTGNSREIFRLSSAGRVVQGELFGRNENLFILTGEDPSVAIVFDIERNTERGRLDGHTDEVRDADFCARKSRLATASEDGTARLWDVETYRQVAVLEGHHSWVVVARFDPPCERLLTAGLDGTWRLWNAEDGRPIPTPAASSAGALSGADFSRNGRRFVTYTQRGNVRVWETATGSELFDLSKQGDYSVRSLNGPSLGPLGHYLLVANQKGPAKGSILVWDVRNDEIALRIDFPGGIYDAVLSRDGDRIIGLVGAGLIVIWEFPSGVEVGRISAHPGSLAGLVSSPDGSRLVTTAHAPLPLVIWDVERNYELLSVGAKVRLADADVIQRRADGIFVAKHQDGELRWQLAPHYHDHISAVRFSADGRRILTAKVNKSAEVLDAETGDVLLTLKGHTEAVRSAAYSPDGRSILTASVDGTVRLWLAENGTELATLRGRRPIEAATFSPDGALVLTTGLENMARLWDVGTGRLVRELETSGRLVRTARFSADGGTVATVDYSGTVQLWAVSSGSEIAQISSSTEGKIERVIFGPSGRWLATGRADGVIEIRDAASGEPLRQLKGHSGAVESLAFSPGEECLLTASSDHTARLWDIEAGAVLWVLEGHRDRVLSARFNRDATRIVTASTDTTVRLWSATTGLELDLFRGHTDAVTHAEFDPTGADRVLSLGDDGTIRLWDVQWASITDPTRLVEIVCAEKLGGGLRRLSAEDTEVAAILRGRESEDVCDPSGPLERAFKSLARN